MRLDRVVTHVASYSHARLCCVHLERKNIFKIDLRLSRALTNREKNATAEAYLSISYQSQKIEIDLRNRPNFNYL